MNPDRLYLTHIAETIADIEDFVVEGKEVAVQAMLAAFEDESTST